MLACRDQTSVDNKFQNDLSIKFIIDHKGMSPRIGESLEKQNCIRKILWDYTIVYYKKFMWCECFRAPNYPKTFQNQWMPSLSSFKAERVRASVFYVIYHIVLKVVLLWLMRIMISVCVTIMLILCDWLSEFRSPRPALVYCLPCSLCRVVLLIIKYHTCANVSNLRFNQRIQSVAIMCLWLQMNFCAF